MILFGTKPYLILKLYYKVERLGKIRQELERVKNYHVLLNSCTVKNAQTKTNGAQDVDFGVVLP